MLKKRGVRIGLGLLVCAALAFLAWPEQKTAPLATLNGTAINSQANGTAASAAPGRSEADANQSALDLALKSISLSQGEGGFELWRLKAEWANMYKEDGLILVEQPRLMYFMHDDGTTMYVQSDKGDINQKGQILRFVDQVRVTLEDKLLTGDILVYNGTAKSMTLPEGGNFATESAKGRADVIIWHIEEQRIEALGNVGVTMNSSSAPAHASPKDAAVF